MAALGRRSRIWPFLVLGLTLSMLFFGYLRLDTAQTRKLGATIKGLTGGAKTPPHPPAPSPALPDEKPQAHAHNDGDVDGDSPSSASTATDKAGNSLLAQKPLDPQFVESAVRYVDSIMSADDSKFSRLQCPLLNETRYAGLRVTNRTRFSAHDKTGAAHDKYGVKLKYFFTLNLKSAAHILPRLLSSMVTVIRFLGKEACLLSITEGNSDDGTWEILNALVPRLEEAGIAFKLQTSNINPSAQDRIVRLAKLRNIALEPLTTREPATIDPDAAVIFFNDVAACPEDILELIYQKYRLRAEMTCAMDWAYLSPKPTFMDNWIARTMTGESFFFVGPDGSFERSWDTFSTDPATRKIYEANQPFQVYACWNGGVVFSAKTVLGEHGLRFRASDAPEEAHQGEPMLFCKDLWRRGLGRIACIPTVNMVYLDDRHARYIKKDKGFVSDLVTNETDALIEWKPDPPKQVKWWDTGVHDPKWTPWDKGGPVDP